MNRVQPNQHLRNLRLVPRSLEELAIFRHRQAALYSEVCELYPETCAPPQLSIRIGGETFRFRHGITFTPYAAATPCTGSLNFRSNAFKSSPAMCQFCSERLIRCRDARLSSGRERDYVLTGVSSPACPSGTQTERGMALPRPAAPGGMKPSVEELLERPSLLIRNHPQYFALLKQTLLQLRDLSGHMGLSLSGLEATSEPTWLGGLLGTIGDLEQQGLFRFDGKVLYSNGSGLYGHPELVRLLDELRWDSVQLSRAHHEASRNARIMRFRQPAASEGVGQQGPFEAVVGALQRVAHPPQVQLSCVLSRPGVATIDEAEAYLRWALGLGVRTVVFRELSRLDGHYHSNPVAKFIDEERVDMLGLVGAILPCPAAPPEAALRPALPDGPAGPAPEGRMLTARPGWRFRHCQLGFYYYGEYFTYQPQPQPCQPQQAPGPGPACEVAFESGNYEAFYRTLEGFGPVGPGGTAGRVVEKLVLHPDGSLCADWHPDSCRLATARQILAQGSPQGQGPSA
ncbi:putative radical SAM protein [Paratrimastix pyriformis]|uniref:Radical SAM protein n=1 Tax=Paratrimastix pyriformis TaxID=342808 RepID=A0ABQ8URI9_9EUKA|nr:putative radical SAM protein [Paratrimastix pyriformis]